MRLKLTTLFIFCALNATTAQDILWTRYVDPGYIEKINFFIDKEDNTISSFHAMDSGLYVVIKTDTLGNEVWRFTDSTGQQSLLDSNNCIYTAGNHYTNNYGYADYGVLRKLSPDGIILWTDTFGQIGFMQLDRKNNIILQYSDSGGNAILSKMTKIDASNTTIWQRADTSYISIPICITPDNSFLMGSTIYDEQGNLVRTVSGPGFSYYYGVGLYCFDQDTNFYQVGVFDYDYFYGTYYSYYAFRNFNLDTGNIHLVIDSSSSFGHATYSSQLYNFNFAFYHLELDSLRKPYLFLKNDSSPAVVHSDTKPAFLTVAYSNYRIMDMYHFYIYNAENEKLWDQHFNQFDSMSSLFKPFVPFQTVFDSHGNVLVFGSQNSGSNSPYQALNASITKIGNPLNQGVVTNIPQPVNRSISVYPNPFNSAVHFSLPDNETAEELSVFDVLGGKIAQTGKVDGASGFNWQAPSNLSSGIYTYHLTTSKANYTGKLIKE